jgi:cell wall-active antibiotic response 4TMS protein YvqF/B-box zinc finger protein
MKCAVHSEVDATGYCRNCGKPLCAECERNVRGALYCEDCLAAKMSGAPAAAFAPAGATTAGVPPTTPEHHGRPGVALVLGFIPGLGAVFNGEYMKALIHVLIFGSLIAAQDSHVSGGFHALLGLAIAAFYFYMPIDAYRVAKARETGGASPEPLPIFDMQGRKPTGAFILIGLGIFLLLSNLGLFDWDWFGKLWPVGLIALGAWILIGRMHRQPGPGS